MLQCLLNFKCLYSFSGRSGSVGGCRQANAQRKICQHIFHRVTVAVTCWSCSSEFWLFVRLFLVFFYTGVEQWKGEINVMVICGQLHCSVNCRVSGSRNSVLAVD